jgi:hypothetical protein
MKAYRIQAFGPEPQAPERPPREVCDAALDGACRACARYKLLRARYGATAETRPSYQTYAARLAYCHDASRTRLPLPCEAILECEPLAGRRPRQVVPPEFEGTT